MKFIKKHKKIMDNQNEEFLQLKKKNSRKHKEVERNIQKTIKKFEKRRRNNDYFNLIHNK